MINFNEWLDNKWQLLLGAGRDNWDDEDMKMAYNKGMERAAEIAKTTYTYNQFTEELMETNKQLIIFIRHQNVEYLKVEDVKAFEEYMQDRVAEAIRNEIETISISDIRKEVEK